MTKSKPTTMNTNANTSIQHKYESEYELYLLSTIQLNAVRIIINCEYSIRCAVIMTAANFGLIISTETSLQYGQNAVRQLPCCAAKMLF